jgi:hypothetical protein
MGGSSQHLAVLQQAQLASHSVTTLQQQQQQQQDKQQNKQAHTSCIALRRQNYGGLHDDTMYGIL